MPDFIVGIWRGGAPIGIAVQEYFEYKNITTDHIAVRTSSYYGIGQQSRDIKVHGLHYLIENANAEHSLLIVDDIFDSGRGVEALIKQIQTQMRKNTQGKLKLLALGLNQQTKTQLQIFILPRRPIGLYFPMS